MTEFLLILYPYLACLGTAAAALKLGTGDVPKGRRVTAVLLWPLWIPVAALMPNTEKEP